jgi:hypothetical protein
VTSSMDLNPEQLRVLRHMLGIDKPWEDSPKPYRNYYCASSCDPTMSELARIGAVQLYDARSDCEWYTCTDAGRAAAIASFKTIQYSASKRRYRLFLDIRECCPDLTFREFLTNPIYRAGQRTGAE